ncbi:MAG: UDP-N-acetylglucosamine 1-carboxyvinyltransferase [Candidatus Latescibacteria bacterium]|nr:UDP-N-acetylglucosamine 1-carboxyvinyltransferase [Candidatus Latescibacterota bacterium]
MEKLIIDGGIPLHGTVTPSGNKNEALPALAAALLTDEEVVLSNVPLIGDARTIAGLVADLGADVTWSDDHRVTIRAQHLRTTVLNPALCRSARASILLAGPTLARCGTVDLYPPGGCKIGRRRVDTHFLAFEALGATVDAGETFVIRAPHGLHGQDLFLDEASVTATENAIMAAVLAKGTTVIRNAACEPHVQGLCRLLTAMGAQIDGIGSNILTIQGVDRLHGAEHRIGPDIVEVGSFIGMAAATGGGVTIRQAAPEHLRMILLEFAKLGVQAEVRGDDVFIPSGQTLKAVPEVNGGVPKLDDGPWPQFPTDLMSVLIVVATQAAGTVLVFEKMFENRLFFVDSLIQMGAQIVLCDPHRAVVVGPSVLRGGVVVSPDIRAGIALVIAALCAKGRSEIRNIGQIDRGYERIDGRLRALGARVERIAEE